MQAPSGTANSYLQVLELAKGGMGRVDVVLRRDGDFRRLVAVKRLLAAYRDDPDFRAMFVDEARLAGLLRHPNVVSVSDVGVDDDGPYLVMDFIEGMSLAKVMRTIAKRNALLPLQFCVRVARNVARGLHASHELHSTDGTPLELVHRDVTPHNIMVSYEGEVRVADFGIAKALGRSSKTSTGILKGKLSYMSPEQLRFHEPDRRSDLFSLGVVLFEMLSGRRLYASDGMEGARRILEEPPPDVLEFRDDVSPALVELLFDLLAKDPDLRPATAAECADRLDTALTELLAEEEPLTVVDYIGRQFAEVRAESKAKLDAAIRNAERRGLDVVASSESKEIAPRRLRMSLVLALAIGVGLVSGIATLLTFGPPSAEGADEPPSEPPSESTSESTSEPADLAAGSDTTEPPVEAGADDETETETSDEETNVAAERPAAARRPRRRPSGATRPAGVTTAPSRSETPPASESGSVPQWGWDG